MDSLECVEECVLGLFAKSNCKRDRHRMMLISFAFRVQRCVQAACHWMFGRWCVTKCTKYMLAHVLAACLMAMFCFVLWLLT